MPRRSRTRTICNGTVSARRNWLTPVVFDPNNPAIIYYGGNVLNKSTDRGDDLDAHQPGPKST